LLFLSLGDIIGIERGGCNRPLSLADLENQFYGFDDQRWNDAEKDSLNFFLRQPLALGLFGLELFFFFLPVGITSLAFDECITYCWQYVNSFFNIFKSIL